MDHPDNTSRQSERAGGGSGQRRRRRGGGAVGANLGSTPTHGERPQRRPPRHEQPTAEPAPSTSTTPTPRQSRRSKFRATLTAESSQPQTSDAASASPHEAPSAPPAENPKPAPRHRPRRARGQAPGDDLTSTLTHALRTPPFPDCPICFNPIRPEHSTWSCSPPTTNTLEEDVKDGEGGSQCCWNIFHLKCVRAWAEKSVKELEEAWRARGESRPGEWRCPGCRAMRRAVPHTYMCFCLRIRHPAPPRIATPHSCAQPCSRPRLTCTHACPLPCHPGPCPPCAVTIQVACFCGKERHSAKCQLGTSAALSFSCAQPCRKPLRCGNSEHQCVEACHAGPCPPCLVQEEVRCWCGRETKRVACGEVKVEDGTESVIVEDDGSERVWVGSYGCGHPCERPFACSHHACSKLCHPPSRMPPPCPFDPERILSCACGRCRVARSSDELVGNNAGISSTRSTSVPLPPRTSCTSPLPTCASPCSKPLLCGHLCQLTCHWDPCPPCTEQIERTCRCGSTKHRMPCGDTVLTELPTSDDTPAHEDILCDKPCQALRACGRHQCGRLCCPLAPLVPLQRAAAKSSKRRDLHAHDLLSTDVALGLDPTTRALHDCDLPCGRVLTCGNHRCPRRDHKGPCPACPQGVFEELVCPCGRTVLEPPIQCGTRLQCIYPCARPAPACGHPHVPHSCHEGVVIAGADAAGEALGLLTEREAEGGGACPPCPFLTEKVCACGKKRVGNVRCSQERVSCGSMCGKLLPCGFHHCERHCHADACGTCSAVCGKPRKSCLPAQHPCTQTCHAPSACPETEPCLAPVTHTCPCGHLRSTVPCSGTKLVLACTGECEIKKRNARLAEALGISEEKREASASTRGAVTWPAELVGVARVLGPRFVGVAEKAFADFIGSDRCTQVLPHMPPDRRKFVHDLASVYRMDTVMVDQEPHRSVQLIRRIDTRVPVPLLSQSIVSSRTMGRMIDLKAGKGAGAGAGAGASAWGGGGGASGGVSVGVGTGRWNAVAKSALVPGTPGLRSGSGTPTRVPSPVGEVVRSCEGSSGGGRLGSGGDKVGGTSVGAGTGMSVGVGTRETRGVWVPPSVQALQRERESATPTLGTVECGAVTGSAVVLEEAVEVPDDWEDDA